MRIFLDCEFNQQEGGLISMGMITEDGSEFYEVVECPETIAPWVKENVMPILEKDPIPYLEFQKRLKTFLKKFPKVDIIADYPDDISRLCIAMIEGPGEWMMVQPITFEIDDRLSAKGSILKHNAISDARALRESWFKINGYK